MVFALGTVASGLVNSLAWGMEQGMGGVSKAVLLVAQVDQSLSPSVGPSIDSLNREARKAIDSTKKMVAESDISPEDIGNQFIPLLGALLTENTPDSRQQAIDFLTTHTTMDQQKAETLLDQWQHAYASMNDKLKKQAESFKRNSQAAINNLAELVLLSFTVLGVGGIASGLGGAFGVVSHKK